MKISQDTPMSHIFKRLFNIYVVVKRRVLRFLINKKNQTQILYDEFYLYAFKVKTCPHTQKEFLTLNRYLFIRQTKSKSKICNKKCCFRPRLFQLQRVLLTI